VALRIHVLVEHASDQNFRFAIGCRGRPIEEHMSCRPSSTSSMSDMKRAITATKFIASPRSMAERISSHAFYRGHKKVEVTVLL